MTTLRLPDTFPQKSKTKNKKKKKRKIVYYKTQYIIKKEVKKKKRMRITVIKYKTCFTLDGRKKCPSGATYTTMYFLNEIPLVFFSIKLWLVGEATRMLRVIK